MSSRWTTQDTNDMLRMYTAGYSDNRIAVVLGRDRLTVRRWRHKLGLGTALGHGGAVRGEPQRAKIAECMRRFRPEWSDCEQVVIEKRHLITGAGRIYQQPARGTPERQWYRYVAKAYDTATARSAYLAGTLEATYQRLRKRPIENKNGASA